MAVPPIPIPMRPPGGGGTPMPPGGGGAPPMGGMIAQVLQQLLSNPAALKGMQNYMQGMPPTAGMPQPGDITRAAMAMPPQGGPPQGGPPMPPESDAGPGQPDEAETMARDQIDKAGQTWDGVDAPTKNDIQRLLADPSPSAIKSFDEQFGQGMAEKYIGDTQDEETSEPTPDNEPDEGEGEAQGKAQGYKK